MTMPRTNSRKKVLVLTVGTGEVDDVERTLLEPMLLSIRRGEWDRIVLLPSHETQEAAQVLSERLKEKGYSHTEVETLPEKGQENGADACFGHFDSVLEGLLGEGFASNEIVADFTRGTKAMSAALVLASVGRGISTLRYVHSERRDTRGMVVSGTEKVGEIRTTLATERRRLELAENLMRRGDFGAVVELLPDISNEIAVQIVPRVVQPKVTACRAAAQIYAAWDRLDYGDAVKKSEWFRADVAEAGEFSPTLVMRQWLKTLAERPGPSDHAKMAKYLRVLACDLLANAERRLREQHLEDALLRGYRVPELIGQFRLFDRGYDSGSLPPEDERIKAFQDRLRKNGSQGFGVNKDKTLTAPRELAARLLKHLDDPFAQRLLRFSDRIKSRNHSVLIHGFDAKAPDEGVLRKILADLEKLLKEDDEKAEERLKMARSLSFSEE